MKGPERTLPGALPVGSIPVEARTDLAFRDEPAGLAEDRAERTDKKFKLRFRPNVR